MKTVCPAKTSTVFSPWSRTLLGERLVTSPFAFQVPKMEISSPKAYVRENPPPKIDLWGIVPAFLVPRNFGDKWNRTLGSFSPKWGYTQKKGPLTGNCVLSFLDASIDFTKKTHTNTQNKTKRCTSLRPVNSGWFEKKNSSNPPGRWTIRLEKGV